MYRIEVGTMFTGDVVRYLVPEPGEGRIIVQRAVADCERCKTDVYIPHYNCMYDGKKIGHSVAHCTANACY